MKNKTKRFIWKLIWKIGTTASFIALFSIILLYVIPQLTQNQDFVKNITKEECWNKTNIYGIGDVINGKAGSWHYYFDNPVNATYCEKVEVDEIEGWFENSCSGVCDCYKSMSCQLTDRFISIFSNETAKNLMINWIENYTQEKVKYENNRLYFEKGSYDDAIKLSMFNDICNIDTISMGELKCKGSISKKSITKEFLDENCECINIQYDIKYGKNPPEYCYEDKCRMGALGQEHPCSFNNNIKECIDFVKENSDFIKCSKYTCQFGEENYFIEVN